MSQIKNPPQMVQNDIEGLDVVQGPPNIPEASNIWFLSPEDLSITCKDSDKAAVAMDLPDTLYEYESDSVAPPLPPRPSRQDNQSCNTHHTVVPKTSFPFFVDTRLSHSPEPSTLPECSAQLPSPCPSCPYNKVEICFPWAPFFFLRKLNALYNFPDEGSDSREQKAWNRLMYNCVFNPHRGQVPDSIAVNERERAVQEMEVSRHIGGRAEPLFHMLLSQKTEASLWNMRYRLRRLPVYVRAFYLPTAGSKFFYRFLIHQQKLDRCIQDFEAWFEEIPDLEKAANLFCLLENIAQFHGPMMVDTFLTSILERRYGTPFQTLIDTCLLDNVVHFLATFIEVCPADPKFLYANRSARKQTLKPSLDAFRRILRSLWLRWAPEVLFLECVRTLEVNLHFLAAWLFLSSGMMRSSDLVQTLLDNIDLQFPVHSVFFVSSVEHELLRRWKFFIWNRYTEMISHRQTASEYCPYYGPLHRLMYNRFKGRVFPPMALEDPFSRWYWEEASRIQNVAECFHNMDGLRLRTRRGRKCR